MRSSLPSLAGALCLAVASLTPQSSHACDREFYSAGYYPAAAISAPIAFGYYIPATPVYAYGYYVPIRDWMRSAYPPPNVPSHHQSAYFSADASPKPVATVTIRLRDGAFEPPAATVAPGTMLVWVNEGQHVHSITSVDGQWDSGDLAPGEVFRARVVHPGAYEFFCRHHRDMRGSVTVK